jgi:hypothetical protein
MSDQNIAGDPVLKKNENEDVVIDINDIHKSYKPCLRS